MPIGEFDSKFFRVLGVTAQMVLIREAAYVERSSVRLARPVAIGIAAVTAQAAVQAEEEREQYDGSEDHFGLGRHVQSTSSR